MGVDFDEAEERRHGLWGLGVLVMIALLVVAFMILFTGGNSGGSKNNAGASYPPGAFSDTTSQHRSSFAAPSSSSPKPSASSPSKVRLVGCADSTCSADVASLANAINAMRQQHGLPPVAASQSAGAQACAATQGSGSSCEPHYIYANVATLNGEQVAQSLAEVNPSWLLASDAKRIEIGFSPASGGHYYCAVLRFP